MPKGRSSKYIAVYAWGSDKDWHLAGRCTGMGIAGHHVIAYYCSILENSATSKVWWEVELGLK